MFLILCSILLTERAPLLEQLYDVISVASVEVQRICWGFLMGLYFSQLGFAFQKPRKNIFI